jgi:endonuclease-3
MPDFEKLIARLKRHYGAPTLPPAHGPLELILWENACYLLPDDRRAIVFEGLRKLTGLKAQAILKAPYEALFALAKMGGMRPEVRVERWHQIAELVVKEFTGDLDVILKQPFAKAKKALKLFPNIGDPGAEKILLFCGVYPGLALESNGLRVLNRVGFGREVKSYSATYRSTLDALEDQLPRDSVFLTIAYLLLRQHGQELCRRNAPICRACPATDLCSFPLKLF